MIRKVADLPSSLDRDCRHPSHHPPSMILLAPGIYEHECPACKHKTPIVVGRGPTL